MQKCVIMMYGPSNFNTLISEYHENGVNLSFYVAFLTDFILKVVFKFAAALNMDYTLVFLIEIIKAYFG